MSNSFSGPITDVGIVLQGSPVQNLHQYGTEHHTSEKRRECIHKLDQRDPEDYLDKLALDGNISDGRMCQWILEDDIFRSWKGDADSEKPLIWVGDRQGAGKTTLAVVISQHLVDTQSANNDWVLYYFCNRQDHKRNTATSILKGLIYQLCNKENGLADILLEKYQMQDENLFNDSGFWQLWRVWQDMVNRSRAGRIFCVIDGVDQCEGETLDYFLKKLSAYFERRSHRHAEREAEGTERLKLSSKGSAYAGPQPRTADLRMILLSRENPSCVVEVLQSFPRLFMKNDESRPGQSSDLERHVEAKVDEISTSVSGGKEMSEETTKDLMTALSNGEEKSFLWINLAAQQLMDTTMNQLKSHVKKLPISVDDIYVQTLLEVPSRHRAHVIEIFKWVALAARPLSPLELVKAIKYSSKKSFSQRMLRKALLPCRGMIQVVQNRQGDKVQFCDNAVFDFLSQEQSALRQNKKLRDFFIVKSNTHSAMANTCVAYLQESATMARSRRVKLREEDELKPKNQAFFNKHPFLEYAIVYWPFHAKQGNTEKTDYSVPFFQENSERRKLWWESYWISLRQLFAWKWTAPGHFSLLHLAAFFDIVPLAARLERQGRIQALLDAEDDQGMKPINWAIKRSQALMVKFLLHRGAFDTEALREAARSGDVSVIKLLLENKHKPQLLKAKSWPGTSVNPFQSLKKVTLTSISEWSKSHEHATQNQLGPISPDFKGYGKRASESLLHIAATCGHEEAISVFLAAGEDYTQATDGGWTCLHNAAWFGRTGVVKLLVDSGADAMLETKEGLTPLHCAVKNSQPGLVEYLLEKCGVNVEAVDRFDLTPFHLACRANNIRIMEILLDHGAGIETRMGQWTPLLWACINGDLRVIQFLLNKGADVSAKWVHVGADAARAVELGPIGLARAYNAERGEAIAHFLERFGAKDINRLTGVELKALPPALAADETYDVPELPDVVVGQPEDAETTDVLEHGDFESLANSDDDIDDESDASDGVSRSRKQSASSVPADGRSRRQSPLRLCGLGIQEQVDHEESMNSRFNDATQDHETRPAPSFEAAISIDRKTDSLREDIIEEKTAQLVQNPPPAIARNYADANELLFKATTHDAVKVDAEKKASDLQTERDLRKVEADFTAQEQESTSELDDPSYDNNMESSTSGADHSPIDGVEESTRVEQRSSSISAILGTRFNRFGGKTRK